MTQGRWFATVLGQNRFASHCDARGPELWSAGFPSGLIGLAARWGVAKR
jgi:hypothetical protein